MLGLIRMPLLALTLSSPKCQVYVQGGEHTAEHFIWSSRPSLIPYISPSGSILTVLPGPAKMKRKYMYEVNVKCNKYLQFKYFLIY